ncbi:MAG TPA: NAD(P)-dependent oxidoreductase [Casimicrobiaceae bacterium]|nr:NAD(P)-dependent oxidoreductase [Casimicrobiaceae bacterium]
MSVSKESTNVGFVGLGIMGHSMAGHVLDAGFALHLFNRSRGKAEALVAKGARWYDNAGDVAEVADVVITMVGYPRDVEAIYLDPNGIVERARPGTILIDMTTSSPELAERIARAAAAKGLRSLDAPVSGGDIGAREARLSIMVGGEASAFEEALPILKLMGTSVVRQGGPGAGQHTKLCNQIVVAGTMLGVCEGLAYAKHSGLDPETVLKSIGGGAASSFLLTNMGARILKRDFAPGFFIEHFVKDMTIAAAEAERLNADLPALRLAKSIYEDLVAQGHGRAGTQALFKRYEG